jgi:hypothetical protein
MLDPAFYQDQLEDAIELIQSKVKDSKPTNKQIWYWLQALSLLLTNYGSELAHPRSEMVAELQRKVSDLEATVKLLAAKSQVETVRIGKTSLGGVQ